MSVQTNLVERLLANEVCFCLSCCCCCFLFSPFWFWSHTHHPLEILCFVCTSIITSAIRAKVTGPSCSFQPAFLALASRGWRFFRGLLRRLLCSTDSLPYLPVAPVPIGYVHTLSHTHTRTHTHLIYTRADGR